jgi:ABC-type multidrug transport system ATPase subunit
LHSHRLSTITAADQILCLHAGKVVEAGTHEELLQMKGRYASMWRKQIRAEQAAEEARMLKDRAEQLRKESAQGTASADTSDNEADGHSHGHGHGQREAGRAGQSRLNHASRGDDGSEGSSAAHEAGHHH